MLIHPQFDPVAVHLGPLAVHWYGLMYLLGFAAFMWLGRKRIRSLGRSGWDDKMLDDLLFYGVLGVVLGGRLGEVLFYNPGYYASHPLEIFAVWQGGMSFHGGFLGVLLAGWLWSRWQKLHFFDTMDFVAPLVPIGLGLGRLGNFINGELWGAFTQKPWGMIFPSAPELAEQSHAALVAAYQAGQLESFARHPTQLYEFALEGVVMFTLLVLYSRKPRPRYAVSGWFALLYGVFRFLVEFVRVPDVQLGYLAFGWLTMGQVLSLPLIVFGLFLLWRARHAPTLQPQVVAAADGDK